MSTPSATLRLRNRLVGLGEKVQEGHEILTEVTAERQQIVTSLEATIDIIDKEVGALNPDQANALLRARQMVHKYKE